MRSVPSFIGEFKHKDKGKNVSALREELPIEREANVRQLKKQILQRLKNEPLLTEGTDGSTGPLDEKLEAAATEKYIALDRNAEKQPEDVDGREVSNSAAGGTGLEIESAQGRRGELLSRTVVSATPCIVEQQTGERETLVSTERRKKSTGERAATILLHENQEPGNYVPSFASQPPASSERRRKTDEIKQKAADRRRFPDEKKHHTSPDIQVNDVTTWGSFCPHTPVSSPSFGRRSGSSLSINITAPEDALRLDTKTNHNFLAVSPRLTRASSFPSVYEAAPVFNEDAHFKDFARKKQDKLEEDLRRVEDCLNQTFSDLKKYLKTE